MIPLLGFFRGGTALLVADLDEHLIQIVFRKELWMQQWIYQEVAGRMNGRSKNTVMCPVRSMPSHPNFVSLTNSIPYAALSFPQYQETQRPYLKIRLVP